MKKPRVLFVTPSLGMGGAEWWMLTLMKYLTRCEVAGVIITCHNYNAVIVAELRRLGVPVILPTEAIDCDVIVGWGGVNIRKMVGPTSLPIVEVAQGVGNPEIQYDHAWAATHLVAVSKAALTMYPAGLRGKVTILENAADIDRVMSDKDCREEWGLRPEQKVVAQIGRLVDVKRPRMLAKALKHLPDNWVAVFCGDGPLLEECVRVAQKSGRKAIFTGVRNDVGNIYQAADVICLPSLSEGLSLAMMEAWLSGKPVVAAQYQSAVDLQEQWEDVLEIVPGKMKPTGLAEGIVRASERVADQNYRTQKIAETHYSGVALAKRWEDYLIGTVLS